MNYRKSKTLGQALSSLTQLTVLFPQMEYNQYSKVQYSSVQYSTVQYSTEQYSTAQLNHSAGSQPGLPAGYSQLTQLHPTMPDQPAWYRTAPTCCGNLQPCQCTLLCQSACLGGLFPRPGTPELPGRAPGTPPYQCALLPHRLPTQCTCLTRPVTPPTSSKLSNHRRHCAI